MTARPSLFSLTVSGKKLILLTVHLTSAFSHLTSKDSKVVPRSFVGARKVVARGIHLSVITYQLSTVYHRRSIGVA